MSRAAIKVEVDLTVSNTARDTVLAMLILQSKARAHGVFKSLRLVQGVDGDHLGHMTHVSARYSRSPKGAQ